MASSDARPPGVRSPLSTGPVAGPSPGVPAPRPALSSITREVSVSELTPLVEATRPHNEDADTAALGGAEMDQLLAPERGAASNVGDGAPPSGAARVAVAPTHVPIAPYPAQLLEPSVVLAPGLGTPRARPPLGDAVPTLRTPPPPLDFARPSQATMVLPGLDPAEAPAPTLALRPPPHERPSQPTAVLASNLFPASAQASNAAPPPAFAGAAAPPAEVPDWTRTHLPPSREVVRTSRRSTALFLGVAAASLVTGSVIAAVVMLGTGRSGTGDVPTRTGSSVPGTPDFPGRTGDVPSRTGDVPSRTGDVPSRTGDVPSRTSNSPSGTSDVPSRTGDSPSRTPDSPSGTADVPPGTPGAPSGTASLAEAEARASLGRLRDGLAACVRDVIHVLPGTSPAVPEKLAALKGGAYKSAPRDFRSPVFSCLKYRETKPQRFQIQWQVTMQPSEGRGVAWLDDDGDGKADRALSFRAALVHKGEVDLGEIGFVTPVPPVMKPAP